MYDITFDVKGINKSEMHTLHHVVMLLSVKELTGHLPSNAVVNKFEHLRKKRIRFPALQRRRVHIIIGIEQSEILRPCDTVCGPEGTLWATR